jgi:archaellum component FlaG (FlaF/FlaG flagellin family)
LPIKRRREKKGTQPTTTAILLIIILFVIVGIYYIWTTVQTRAGNEIRIQSIANDDGNLKVYVQNTGPSTVTIDLVQINNQTFNIQPANCTVASQQTTTIQPGQTAEITITQAITDKVHVKVFCKDGTFYEMDWQPP